MTKKIIGLGLLLFSIAIYASEFSVQDDTGKQINLPQAAKRVLSLSPHLTELLFAAGAGQEIVGVVNYSDYPEAAQRLPIIGTYEKFDLERILILQPDLIFAWQSGNPAAELAKLAVLDIPIFVNEPRHLEDIAVSLEKIGVLTGHTHEATAAANRFREDLKHLENSYRELRPVRVFYQIWHRPLFTFNGDHVVSDVLRRCGGVNVFADLAILAPQISVEAVLQRQPQVIIAGIHGEASHESLQFWRQWRDLPAVKQENLFFLNPDLINRHTPRILQGMRLICEFLQQARAVSVDQQGK